jgi:hypothetical protein
MNRRTRLASVLAVSAFALVALGACSSTTSGKSRDGGGGTGEPETPAEKCNFFINQYCIRVVGCGITTDADCQKQTRTELDCAKVVQIGPTYEKCVQDVAGAECAALQSEIPTSCNGVLLTE